MNNSNNTEHPLTSAEFVDGLIRVALLLLLVVLCFQVFSPFLHLMVWALILGVTLFPLHQKLAAKLGGKQGSAATLMTLVGVLLLGAPSVMLGSSMAAYLTEIFDSYQAGTLVMPEPAASVRDWPVIGDQVHEAWTAAADDFPAFVEANRAAVESAVSKGLAVARSTAGGVVFFIGALVVAGIMMAYGRSGSGAMLNIFNRVAGPVHGPNMHSLVTMTTRSVAVGVLGVAVIQSLLSGVVFLLAGVPAAGLLALVILFLAIMQLPGLLVGIPVILWIWNNGDASTGMNVVWTVLVLLTGLADNILKPVLLGRGVDAPMPVILIGALGGMVSSGFVGLFTGAVVLAVGYQLFMQWVDNARQQAVDTAGEAGTDE